MQITDMLNQYNRNLANGMEVSNGTQGIKEVVSSLNGLSVGNIFEGSINHMENGVVTLGLSDGKTIQARLDSGVSVKQGETMFFQVKSSNGNQIAIRPYSNGVATNPTLLNALEAANLQVNDKMLTMVNTMMEQSMSIDKQSILDMAKLVMGNDGMDVTSIVQMTKLGIPVTEEMTAQFENYKSDQYALLTQLESAMEVLPEQLSKGSLGQKELLDFNQQMVRVFLGEGLENGALPEKAEVTVLTGGQMQEAGENQGTMQNTQQTGNVTQAEKTVFIEDIENVVQKNGEALNVLDMAKTAEEGQSVLDMAQTAEEGQNVLDMAQTAEEGQNVLDMAQTAEEGQSVLDMAQAAEEGQSVLDIGQAAEEAQNVLDMAHVSEEAQNVLDMAHVPEEAKTISRETVQKEVAMEKMPDALKNLFTNNELQQLFEQLGKIPELSRNPKLFRDGEWNTNITSKELLQFFEQAFSSKNPFSRQALSELVSSKEYRTLIRNVMEQQWLLKPEELKSEHKVNELYERLDRQLGQMEKVLNNFGQNTSQLSDTAASVRNNIQFMNQINQTYAYVQIPLKLAGQNAHSDLYVYTDKRKMHEKDGELTAFLHLDMEHLGSTDVSIKLYQKKVQTNFYLDDDVSYQLILEHMDILEKRLEEKGYYAKIQVINQEEKPNFVENILKQGAISTGGMVHRYSFDVRA